MRRRPRQARYRNLTARGGVIYYQRVVAGRRIRLSAKTDDWDEAAAFRDLYEQRKGIRSGVPILQCPEFGEFASRYLKEATGHLAATTREDRQSLLGEQGRVTRYFASHRLDEITRRTLLEWWNLEVVGRERSIKTGRNYLDAVSAVLGYAVDLELIETNPVDSLRATLRRRNRTQRGRAEADPAANIRPIEDLEDLAALVEKSAAVGGDGHLVDLLQLDAGLRLGEAIGLRWCDVWWGRDVQDITRALVIQSARARGRHLGKTKSGRSRRVALSRRLSALLQERWIRAGRPQSALQILGSVDPANYRNRHFRNVCVEAELGHLRPKDLRDTFASQLLTAGIQLGYISQQLGHADVAVTARHYAKWAGGDLHRVAAHLVDGEVPADLVGRLRAVEKLGGANR